MNWKDAVIGSCGRCGGNIGFKKDSIGFEYVHEFLVMQCLGCGSTPIPFEMQDRRKKEPDKEAE